MNIRRSVGRFHFGFSNGYSPSHGPQVWASRWKRFTVSIVRAGVVKPSRGWHVWIYYRGVGVVTAASMVWFYIDGRRDE